MNIKQFLIGWFWKKPTKRKKIIKYNEKEIIKLRNLGFTQQQIAEEVKLTRNQVVGILFKLIKEGKISRKRLKKAKK